MATGRVIECRKCSKRVRWHGRESARVTCPGCGAKLVVLLERDDSYTVLVESDDAVAEMVCDWVGGRVDDDDLEDEILEQKEPESLPAPYGLSPTSEYTEALTTSNASGFWS